MPIKETQKSLASYENLTIDSIQLDDKIAFFDTSTSTGKIGSVSELQKTLGLTAITVIQPTPTLTGNTTNLNSIFKDSSGDSYVVDKDGNSTKLSSIPFSTLTDIRDNTFNIRDNSDPTKIVQFEVSATATGSTETKTLKAGSGTIPQENTSNTFTAPQSVVVSSGGTNNVLTVTNTNANTSATSSFTRTYRSNQTGTANSNINCNSHDGINIGTVTPVLNNVFTGITFGSTGSNAQGHDFFYRNADTTRNPFPYSTFFMKANGEQLHRNTIHAAQEAVNATTSTTVNGNQVINIHGGVTAGNHILNLPNSTIGGSGTAGVNLLTSFYGGEFEICNLRSNSSDIITVTPNGTDTINGQATLIVSPGDRCKIKYTSARGGWDILAFSKSSSGLAQFRATSNSGQSIPSGTGTTIDYNLVSYDSASAYNTTTKTYTAPAKGKYTVNAIARIASGSYATGNEFTLIITKNGIQHTNTLFPIIANGTGLIAVRVTDTVDCNQGDTIQINLFQTTGGARLIDTFAPSNILTINQI